MNIKPSTTTDCVLSLRYDSNQDSATPEIPKVLSSRLNRIPEQNELQLFLVAQEVSWSGYLLILATPTRHSKGAPLCRYTGVTTEVPFTLRPKNRKKVSVGY